MTAVVLVEGESDKAAVEALARRQGRDLAAEGVEIVAIGGAQAVGRVLAGLGDVREEAGFRGAFERIGRTPRRQRPRTAASSVAAQ